MRKRIHFVLPLVCLLHWSASGGVAADVAVHLVNARTGKPVPNTPTELSLLYGPAQEPQTLRARTDARGLALFQLDDPLPGSVMVHLGTFGGWLECLPLERPYRLKEILTSGVSRMGSCWRNVPDIDKKFRPKPGDLFFFVVRLNWFERRWLCGRTGCRATYIAQPPTSADIRASSRYQITIRMVNGETGSPMGGKWLGVFRPVAKNYQEGRAFIVTDADGTAVYGFDDPATQIKVILDEKGSRTCSVGRVAAGEVMQKGVVAPNICDPSGKLQGKFTPKPGEMVVFAKVH